MDGFVPLLADADWIKLLIFLLFFLGPLLGQLFKGNEQAAPRQRRPRPQRPPQRPDGNEAGAQPAMARGAGGAGGREALEAEIDQFLRQANRGGAEAEVLQAEIVPVDRREERRLGEPIGQREPGRRQRSAGPRQPVQQPSSPPPQRNVRLGREIGQADERLESRLRDVFEHDLGGLRSQRARRSNIQQGTDADVWQTGGAADAQQPAPFAASEVREALRNPDSVRQAILWAEILKRPAERGMEL